MLLYLLKVLWRGWWSLSRIDSNLLRVLLSATVVRHSSSVPTTAPAFQSPSIPLLNAASPAHHSIKEETGNHRLVKHAQKFVADIEGPQPPQEIEPALTLPVERSPSPKYSVKTHSFFRKQMHDLPAMISVWFVSTTSKWMFICNVSKMALICEFWFLPEVPDVCPKWSEAFFLLHLPFC